MSSSDSSSSPDEGLDCLEELDTEFKCDIKTAKDLIKDLKRPRDRQIGGSLITRVMELNSNSLEVKANRNEFVKYFLKILKVTVDTQPDIYDEWFAKNSFDAQETSMWSTDKRTFVATKTIPGFGVLVYLAVSYQPELGWQEHGFLSYKF